MKADDEVEDGGRDDDLEHDARKEGEDLAQVAGQRAVEAGGDLPATEGYVFRELVDDSVENREGALANVDEENALESDLRFEKNIIIPLLDIRPIKPLLLHP